VQVVDFLLENWICGISYDTYIFVKLSCTYERNLTLNLFNFGWSINQILRKFNA